MKATTLFDQVLQVPKCPGMLLDQFVMQDLQGRLGGPRGAKSSSAQFDCLEQTGVQLLHLPGL